MLPYLRLFGKDIPTYSLMCLLGIGAVVAYVLLRRKRFHIPNDDAIHIIVMGIVGALIGAKLLYIITILPEIPALFPRLKENPILFADLLIPGYVFYGGLLGGLFAVWRYCRRYAVSFKNVSMIIAGAVPLFHIFGRIGCFLAGCCYGIPVSCGLVFTQSLGAPNGIPLLPIQLIEAGINLLLFTAVMLFQRFSKHPERSLLLYLCSYAGCRFLVEFFRGDAVRGVFFGVSTSQWISLGILLFFVIRGLVKKLGGDV